MNRPTIQSALALLALSGVASAQVVDGENFDSEYGGALWSQTVGTSFGNSTDPGALNSSGSEIDNIFGTISGTTLFLGVGGNLETNFNKLNLVLDFRPGGQNTLMDLPNLGALNGLTLDTGVEADVVLSYTNGNPPQGSTGSGEFEHFLDGANVGGGGGFLAGGVRSVIGAIDTTLDGAQVVFDSNHLNVGGVGAVGDLFDSDPATVFTGIEMSIDLGPLGWDGISPILVAGWINGSGNDFLSNQAIGGVPQAGLPADPHLGPPSGVNFAQIEGNQFVVIPAPGAMALLGIGGLITLRRRR